MDVKPHESDGAAPHNRVRRFPIVALLLWAFVTFAVPRVVQTLNLIDVGAFPLGFFMAAQGSLIALLIIAIQAARWQDRIAAAEDQ